MAAEVTGTGATHEAARRLVRRDLCELAPRMRRAVQAMLKECHARSLDAMVYEAMRTDELARMYFQLGASKARDARHTWHGYGLAVDVISLSRAWKAWEDPVWTAAVVAIAKKHGLDWGGDWETFVDKPHFQWGQCRPSPSAAGIALYQSGGLKAVWEAVGAVAPDDILP